MQGREKLQLHGAGSGAATRVPPSGHDLQGAMKRWAWWKNRSAYRDLMKPAACLIFLMGFAGGPVQGESGATELLPVTGDSFPECVVFDEVMQAFMKKHHVPGASLAVSRNGRLVHARGYGYADRDAREPVQPTSLFRIASLSKPVTAAAVMKLVEDGKLSLDDRPYELLSDLKPPAGRRDAKHAEDVTVLDLLRHTGGQGSRVEGSIGNPMQRPFSKRICAELGTEHPPTTEQVIAYMRSHEFEFEPGTRHSYSNYGYLLLGKVIEKVSGMPYDRYVNHAILEPLGIHGMRIGLTKRNLRAPGEVVYHAPPGLRLFKSVFEGEPKGPWPYAGWHHEGWGASGAWLGSAVGMVRFADEFDPSREGEVLGRDSIARMLARQEVSATGNGSFWYGLGWRVQKGARERFNIWHTGGHQVGALSYLMRMQDGSTWSAHFNCCFKDDLVPDPYEEFNKAMQNANRSIRKWPAGDFFDKYLDAMPPADSGTQRDGVAPSR